MNSVPRFSKTPGLALDRPAEPRRARACRCFTQQLRATQMYPMAATRHHPLEVHYNDEYPIANSCPSDLALQKTGG